MVIKKRKKQPKQIEAQVVGRGVFAFPRFYIKAVTGSFTVYHRLTHSYIGSAGNEEELVSLIGEWESLTEKELWTRLIKSRGFSISNVVGMSRDKYFQAEEDWYEGSWGTYTTKFFEKYPELFREVAEVPKQIVNEVRQDIASEQKREHEKHVAHIEEKEREYRAGTKPVEKKPEEVKRVPSIIKRKPKETPPAKKEEEKPKKKVIKKFKMPNMKI